MTFQTGTLFVHRIQKDACMNDGQTLEERIKRYAARRKKGIVEDDLLSGS